MRKKLISIILLLVPVAVFAKVNFEPVFFKIQQQFYDSQETTITFFNSISLDSDENNFDVGLDVVSDELGISLADAAAMSEDELWNFKCDLYNKKIVSGWFFLEGAGLVFSINYEHKNTQVEFCKFKLGVNVFDTDRLLSIDEWRNCSTKFFVPLYVEFNLMSMLFDDTRYFYNPEINFGIDLNLIAFRNFNIGFTAMEKFSVRNMLKELMSGKDSVKDGLRGNIPSSKFCVSVYLRIFSMDNVFGQF